MPVTAVARNLMDSITVLASDIKGTHSVEWAAAGDPSGDDIQYIPEAVLESVAFKRALARDVVALVEDSTDPEVVEAMAKQVKAFARRQAGAQENIDQILERPSSRDHVAQWCVAPANGGNGQCGGPVSISSAQAKDVPPLCPKHKGLAHQFVPEIETKTEGEKSFEVTKWIHVGLGPRES